MSCNYIRLFVCILYVFMHYINETWLFFDLVAAHIGEHADMFFKKKH